MNYTEGYKEMVRKAWPEHFLADTNVSKMDVSPQEEGIIPMFPNVKNTAAVANSGSGIVINAPAELDTIEEQRKFLGRVTLDAFVDKMNALSSEYKIRFDWRPATAQEAVERLKAGLFTIRGADKKDPVKYTYLEDLFSWRGPDDQADEKGFAVAVKKLDDTFSALMIKLRIADPKDGLELFEAFKATA